MLEPGAIDRPVKSDISDSEYLNTLVPQNIFHATLGLSSRKYSNPVFPIKNNHIHVNSSRSTPLQKNKRGFSIIYSACISQITARKMLCSV